MSCDGANGTGGAEMSGDAIRLMTGLPVAALLPLGLPALRENRVLYLATGIGYAAFVLAPLFPDWRAWVLLAAAGAGCALSRLGQGNPGQAALEPAWIESMFERRHAVAPAVALLLAAAAGLAAGPRTLGRYARDVLFDERLAIGLSGTLAAVFLGGLIVGQVLRPHTDTLRRKSAELLTESSEVKALVGAGMLIGWLERAIVFAFVLAGQPTAAVLVLTAKSVARFPALRRNEEGFAEYFLIGSLTSLAAALAAALATRWLLAVPLPG